MARNRASMREGPLAELFRATEAAQRQAEQEGKGTEPAKAPPEEPMEQTAEHVPDLVREEAPPAAASEPVEEAPAAEEPAAVEEPVVEEPVAAAPATVAPPPEPVREPVYEPPVARVIEPLPEPAPRLEYAPPRD